MDFKKAFRQRRKEMELTQVGAAQLLGVDQTTISGWESGKRRPVDPRTVLLIESKMEIPRQVVVPEFFKVTATSPDAVA